MQNLTFPVSLSLGLSGKKRCVVGFVVPDVLAERGASIFNDHYIPFETSGNSLNNEASRPSRLDRVYKRTEYTKPPIPHSSVLLAHTSLSTILETYCEAR